MSPDHNHTLQVDFGISVAGRHKGLFRKQHGVTRVKTELCDVERQLMLSETHEFLSSSTSAVQVLPSPFYVTSLLVMSVLQRCVAPASPVDSHQCPPKG